MNRRFFLCPEEGCAFEASVTDRAWLNSTDGPLEHVKIWCPAGHYFFMLAESLEIA